MNIIVHLLSKFNINPMIFPHFPLNSKKKKEEEKKFKSNSFSNKN